MDADIAALEAELETLKKPPPADKKQSTPKRAALPHDLPHVEISHEPDSTTCACTCAPQRVGEDVSQKLDYTPCVFTVQNHVRGTWACRGCRTMTQAPVAMLALGKGKTHRAYLWAYLWAYLGAYAAGAFEPLRAVVYDFTLSRSGEHARTFLGDWKGSLVCDD